MLISACSDDDDGRLPFAEIDGSMLKWHPYPDVANTDSISFTSSASISVAYSFSDYIRGINCLDDGVTRDCEIRYQTLWFRSPNSDREYYLNVVLLPERSLTFNYSSTGGISTEIARTIFPDNAPEIPLSDIFDVMYLETVTYNGMTTEGFRITTRTTSPPFLLDSPPKEVLYLANFGVVEWSDYSGNTFFLQ
ncbi:hypothetical protein A3850_001720 [Lewinella sp. 4G2]|nr:hypothetical protein A3850_001720 [Lewinella sp. 4G2]